ncbi:MAG: phosphoglucomutase/phosphomannomutase family protein [Verrucomicrobiota bacterium]|jgi:phosphomannomutase
MSNTKIKFGTDGWRGVIADDFTFTNVRRVAQATADYWNSQPLPKKTIVGYDTRFFSEVYARLVCEVLTANGIETLYAPEAVPTPAISFAVRDQKLCGAVMITASHNPPEFNGYKIKAEFAGSATPEICTAIESRVDATPVMSAKFDGAVEIYDPRLAHVAFLKKMVDLKAIKRAKLRVVFDSMHGCGGRVLEKLAGGTTIRADRDVLFGGVNPEPTGKNLGALMTTVKAHRAHIGLATDGDADRLGVVDDRGRYVSIQLVFAVLLLHVLRNRQQRQGIVVKSGNCTVLIDRICQSFGLKCVEVPVGFKWICQQMREQDVLMGGEESGGLGFRGHIPERDGMLANLMLLELLAMTGKKFSQLLDEVQKEFGKSAYERIDMHFPLEKRQQLLEYLAKNPPATLAGAPLKEVKTYDGVKYIANDDSWLMFRTSGTEPIIRIYSEAASATKVRQLLNLGQQTAMEVA